MIKNLSIKDLKKEFFRSEKLVDANMNKASAKLDKLQKQHKAQSIKIKKDIDKYLS